MGIKSKLRFYYCNNDSYIVERIKRKMKMVSYYEEDHNSMLEFIHDDVWDLVVHDMKNNPTEVIVGLARIFTLNGTMHAPAYQELTDLYNAHCSSIS